MNERIKELEQMCWEELGEEESYYPVFNTKKFAELIIKECVDIAHQESETQMNTDGQVAADRIWATIKNRFGA